MDGQGHLRTERVLTGGLAKRPDVHMTSADEVCVMARYAIYAMAMTASTKTSPSFLQSTMPSDDQVTRFTPNKEVAPLNKTRFARYRKFNCSSLKQFHVVKPFVVLPFPEAPI